MCAWGRAGKLALADLRELGHTSPALVRLDDTQVRAFDILKERLRAGKPKAFIADEIQKPALLFTDGALEYDGDELCPTIGAVCIFLDGSTEVFGSEVPKAVLDVWRKGGKTHVIGLVELYACVLSLVHWKTRFSSRRVIMFVDNWPALDVIVKGTSLQEDRRKLLLLLEGPDEDSFLLWVARVPSSSNVSDHPSRGSLAELSFLRPFTCVNPTCPMLGVTLDNTLAEADLGEKCV